MGSAADRLADDVLEAGFVPLAEAVRPALGLLQQVPELGLLALGQVLLDPVPAFFQQPEGDDPDFRPWHPLPIRPTTEPVGG